MTAPLSEPPSPPPAAPLPRPLSVVIPTLDVGTALPGTLDALQAGAELIGEIILADGGSRDGLVALAEGRGLRLVACPPGRGQQLAGGAAAAAGGFLLFLHADTCLSPDWPAAVRAFMAAAAHEPRRAGVFRLTLDDPSPKARSVERLARWRGRALGLPYGDQGLLIARSFYDELGGFKAIALMEDVDLVRRIGRHRLVHLAAEARTSAARYRREGWRVRALRNLSVLTLYYLGLPTRLLVRLYG